MQAPPPKLVALAFSPRAAKDILRLASPRFDVSVTRSSTAALSAVQSSPAVRILVAEHGLPADVAPHTGPSGIALLEACRIRCPHVRRLLLVPADRSLEMLPMVHNGLATSIICLPIAAKDFVSAICADITPSQAV